MIITEKELLKELNIAKSILLVEPNYKRKYPPLGLMKISGFAKQNNKQTVFSRVAVCSGCDLICVTTLFTYDNEIVCNTLRELRFLNPNTKIIIGGVAASVNAKKFEGVVSGLYIFVKYSSVLDNCIPDYDTDWGVDDMWKAYSYVFTTRGCPNSCKYCFVPKIEPWGGIVDTWKQQIDESKKKVMIYDNNITAHGYEHIYNVATFCSSNNIKARLDNAVDIKYVNKQTASALAIFKLEKRGLRTAFDRIEEDGAFQVAIEELIMAGISKYNIIAYVLFNFTDKPAEAHYRASECRRLGITPYPACFQPLNQYNRKNKYISRFWTKKLSTAFMHYWLYAGINRNYSFEEYATGDGAERYKLDSKDWDMWNTSK